MSRDAPRPLPVLAIDAHDLTSARTVIQKLTKFIEETLVLSKSVTKGNKAEIRSAASEIHEIADHLELLGSRVSGPGPGCFGDPPLRPSTPPTLEVCTPPTSEVCTEPSFMTPQALKDLVSSCMRSELRAFKPDLVSSLNISPAGAASGDSKREIITSMREEMKRLKDELNPKTPTTPTARNASYATMLAAPAPKKVAPLKPAIIVKSTDSNMKPQEVMDEWKKCVSFKAQKYAPAKIQPVSNGKVRVEFDNKKQCEETIARTKSVPGLDAEEAKRRPPLLIIKGIPKTVKREELTEIIKSQNTVEDLRLCFLLSNRNEKLYNAVIEVRPESRRQIMESGKINIDHQRVHIEDYSRFVQCFRCLQYGHTRGKCTAEVTPCAHCARVDHTTQDCPNKENEKRWKCYNCQKHNEKSGSSSDVKHSATNANICPRIKLMKSRIDQQTDYGY